MPAQNTNPPNPPQNPPTPKSNPLSGRDRWLQDAQQHTDEFNRNGPRAPAAWVLTSGREIPGGAFEAGKEGDKTLYVARAYVEVKSSCDQLDGGSRPHLDFQIQPRTDSVWLPISRSQFLVFSSDSISPQMSGRQGNIWNKVQKSDGSTRAMISPSTKS